LFFPKDEREDAYQSAAGKLIRVSLYFSDCLKAPLQEREESGRATSIA
jgi:hypothetical protein